MKNWRRTIGRFGIGLFACGLLAMLFSIALQAVDPSLQDLCESISMWILAVVPLGIPLVWIGQGERTHKILCGEWLHCPKCKYDLSGLPVDDRQQIHCPECGDDFGVSYIQEYWKDTLGPKDGESS